MKQVQGIPNFFQHENGIYYVRKVVAGRQVWKSTRTRNRKDAMRRHNEIVGELYAEGAGWAPKEIPTLGEWWDLYRDAKRKSEKTRRREAEVMRLRILPKWRHVRLDKFTRNMFERHLQGRRREKMKNGRLPAKDTVTREQSMLHAIFQAAVDDELIPRNPLKKIPRDTYTVRTRVITLDEQRRILEHLKPDYRRWFLFLLGTGLRVEEARGINPQTDIDWGRPSVRVKGKGHHGEPKMREVPLLSAALVELLKRQIEANKAPRDTYWHPERKNTLWPQTQDRMRQVITRACKKAEVDYFSPHTLRHTFATRYLASGGDIYALSKILGHSSVEITEKVYSHLLTADLIKMSQDRNVELHLDDDAAVA